MTEVKEKILKKSADMFLTLGVKSVTMDEIAAELGISKKTIYANFSTKTKLIEATALYIFEKISTGIEQIRQQSDDPIRKLFVIKQFAMEHLKDEKSSPQYQLQKYYPKTYHMIKQKQQRLLEDLVKENLERGIALGLYREDLPLDFISRIYFVGIVGIKDRELFPESQYSTQELVEKHLEYHLRAIVTPQGLVSLDKLLKLSTEK